MARFKIQPGKLLVIPPGDKPRWEPVNVVYDSANDMFGVQATGPGQLQGYVFFVGQQALRACRDTGAAADTLKAV